MIQYVKDYTSEKIKDIFSLDDYAAWMKLEEKGKRLGEIVRNPKMASMHADATRGMRKLHGQKQRLLKKYGINCK